MATTNTQLTKTEFEQFAKAICKALAVQTGDSWTTEFPFDNDWNQCFNLLRYGKKRLWGKPNWDKQGMITFFTSLDSGENPQGYSYNYDRARKENTLQINCGMSKTPEKIAKDLINRLVPSAIVLADAAILDVENEKMRQGFAERETARLVDALGSVGNYRQGNGGNSPSIDIRFAENFDCGYGEVKPSFYSDGKASVAIELRSLPLETAIKICQALATIKANKTNT